MTAMRKPTALIIEGGGMRNAYTAAVIATFIQVGVEFQKVYGISAGAELAADYVAGADERARNFFVTLAGDKRAGGVGSFFRGRGFFNTAYAFGQVARDAGKPGGHPELAFDFDAFLAHPADLQIQAFDIASGATRAWNKRDIATLSRLMDVVAASCAYPLFTPEVEIDGRRYIDGGMGTSRGICLEAARADGFERFFVVRSRPRDFRMPQLNVAKRTAYRLAYAEYPKVYEAICARPSVYNRILDELDQLAAADVAYVFCPDAISISYLSGDARKLEAAYRAGERQCARDLDRWLDFLY